MGIDAGNWEAGGHRLSPETHCDKVLHPCYPSLELTSVIFGKIKDLFITARSHSYRERLNIRINRKFQLTRSFVQPIHLRHSLLRLLWCGVKKLKLAYPPGKLCLFTTTTRSRGYFCLNRLSQGLYSFRACRVKLYSPNRSVCQRHCYFSRFANAGAGDIFYIHYVWIVE